NVHYRAHDLYDFAVRHNYYSLTLQSVCIDAFERALFTNHALVYVLFTRASIHSSVYLF
ncbi:MAG: hypothetical protein ACJAYI_001082, partial [Myxococcota bacterium]